MLRPSLSFVLLAVLGVPSFDLHQPRRQKRVLDSDSESDVDPDVRRSLLGEFSKRFGFHIPVFLQASDRLIKKLARRRRKKMTSAGWVKKPRNGSFCFPPSNIGLVHFVSGDFDCGRSKSSRPGSEDG